MNPAKLIQSLFILLFIISCGPREDKQSNPLKSGRNQSVPADLPLDKGFSKYIAGFTSGIIPSNTPVEIRLTPEFAATADRSASGLFFFEPSIKGKTEWKDETTIAFIPSKPLEEGTIYSGGFNLTRLSEVEERLKVFPIRIQTLKKDFRVSLGALVCENDQGNSYALNGEIITSDFIPPSEVESYLTVKNGRKKPDIIWEHSERLVHRFSIQGIKRNDNASELVLSWDGTSAGVNQKGSSSVRIPAEREFSVLDVISIPGEGQRVDVVFSDPLDGSQELIGLIHFSPGKETTVSINKNVVSLFPVTGFAESTELNIEASLKNNKGITLPSAFHKQLDFTPVPPSISLAGNGIILPSSQNLIFPFKAANLKAVDLKIVRIFEDNLPYFLQESDLNGGYSLKRFGVPVYSGRVDLVPGSGENNGSWNLYTIDLSDYIDVEPGILYKVYLGMRKSYSLFPCASEEESKYEEMLDEAGSQSREGWDDPDNYYDESADALYYSFNFDWRDSDDPCKEAYYGPDKRISRNVFASNLGLIAKKGNDNILHVIVNDLISALPLNEVSIGVYDYQMQLVVSGKTDQNGSVELSCERRPFLIIASKDKDRNYLKTNDGSSLSLSSFDVDGSKPENGIKAFIYGERDVWRPGDSIYVSVIIKDLLKELPAGHPVQFELINPLEQRVDNQIRKPDGSNLLVFKTLTAQDAITGNYKALIRIGGATFEKRIRIETIKPNRLKINLTFPGEILGGTDPVSRGTMNVKWMNGSVARNMRSSVDYILKHSKTEFAGYSQYVFDDPATRFFSETVNIFNAPVDGNGNAGIVFDAGKVTNAPGMLNAVFTAKSMEPGGDESIIQTTYNYAPYPVFAGINVPALKGKSRMLFTDNDNEVKIVTVDKEGNPVNSEVEISVYKISYRWWWESDQEDLAYYISNDIYKPVIVKTISTLKGEGTFRFKIAKEEWGRYLIRVTTPEGHSTGKILLIDWPWEYGMKGNAEAATMLAISTDKEKYNPGDEVSLTFPSPEKAYAIITLENSTGVLEELRVNTEKGNTKVTFRAKPLMAPNIYAYVTIIQPHAQTVNDMPVRLYGVIPVMVEDPQTRLMPVINMSDEVRSQKPFRITVSEENKKAMTYTLAVVDEGLLDITGFKTPDPWNYFYAREALSVQTWDLYDLVLGAFGGTLERIFAIGGDEQLMDKTANKAQRFRPVVKFLGPFTLESGKTNTHTITLPQYTGSVRTMVIAGNDRSFGIAEKPVFVRDPLMALVTAPRVISPREKAALPVTLFVQKNDIKEITIKASSNNLVSFEDSVRTINASATGEIDTELSFITGDKTGIARINITASGGGETTTYDMELEVRSPNPPESRSELKILGQGEKWITNFTPFGIEGSNSAVLEASYIPSINLEKRLQYLIEYPHGCSEQIISAAFPQIWINDLKGTNPDAARKVSVNITEAVNLMMSRQMASGGIALWPGSSQPDNWVTSYAGHFMIEAERKGYNIPAVFMQKWLSYQRKTAQDWRYDTKYRHTANDQAYRLFTLALAGYPEKGAMNRLRETPEIPQVALWLLAGAFATSGRPEVAGKILDMRNIQTEKEYSGYYYGSEIRDKAIILYTLTLLGNQEQALPVLKEISDNFSNDTWYSTQSVAWGLFSYMKWVELMPENKSQTSTIGILLNGEKTTEIVQRDKVYSGELKLLDRNNSLTIENSSDKPIYITLTRKGIPLTSEQTPEEKGLSMKISYLNMDLKPVDHRDLTQGSDFLMVVNVTNRSLSAVDNIALTQMVPSGWEIQNTRLFEADFGVKDSPYDYRDIRDDRVNTYFSLTRGQTKTFVLVLNAAYKGDFYQPSVWCEAMYSAGYYSRFPGNTVKVTGEEFE